MKAEHVWKRLYYGKQKDYGLIMMVWMGSRCIFKVKTITIAQN